MDYFTHEARLRSEGFYPQLISYPQSYTVRIPTMKLKKIPEATAADPCAALLACEVELRDLLSKPEWRHAA